LIIFFTVFVGLSCALGEEARDLGPLVITKQKSFLLNTYSTDPAQSGAFNYQSLPEALGLLPVDLQSRSLASGIQTDFSLRGSTFSQVLVLLNGQRINDPQTAHHNSDIPFTKADIKNIQVIPGAGSSLFGPDAIGGALNFALLRPAEKKMIWEFAAGSQRNGYGLFSVSDKFKDLGWRLSVEDAQSRGFAFDTDYQKFTAALGLDWQLPLGSWRNNFGYQEKEFGAYDFYTPGRGYPSREWTKTYLFSSALDWDKDGLLIKPNFLWRRHFDKFALDQSTGNHNDHRTDMLVPGIYLQKDTGAWGKLGLGLEWSQEKIVSTSLGRHSRQHQGVYVDDRLSPAEKWDLGFSLRMDNFSDYGQEYTGAFNLKYKFNPGIALNFGISRSLRIPSFTELYYNDAATLGNAELAAEKAWNYQAGLELIRQGFSCGLVFFLRQERQMIDWVRADPSEKWQARNFTSDDVFGVEYSLHKKLNRLFSLDAYYAYTDKVIDNQGYLYKYGPNYAQHLAKTVFSLELPFGRQEIGFNYKKRPGRKGWLLLDAGLNYNLNKHSQVFVSSTNLLDVEYQDIVGIPQSGRSIQAGLRWEW